MPDNNNVCVVLVTFNRLSLLKKTLASLAEQSLPPAKILVIDNASTDDTQQFCQSVLGKDQYVNFEYIRLSENTGGAGGFHYGMKLASDRGFEWIWLMDDDVFPEQDCLANLLTWKSFSKCIHPHAVESDSRLYHWARIIVPGSLYMFHYHENLYQKSPWFYSNMACFEGMLIHRDIVRSVGLPDPRFFIAWDDTIYGLKVSTETNIIQVRNAILNRALPRGLRTGRSLYYTVRNMFLSNTLVREMGFPLGKLNGVLNLVILIRIIRGSGSLLKNLRPILLGLYDGFRGKFGQTKRTF